MNIPFDGLFTLLIFLISIPALVLQFISPVDRRATMKNNGLDVLVFLKRALWVIVIGLAMQFFITHWLASITNPLINAVDKGLIEQFIWLLIFLPLFVLVIQVSKQLPEKYARRESIVEKLTKDVLNEAEKKGRAAGETFVDLANLGNQCNPGVEREMVVNAFAQIVKKIMSNPGYAGDSFEDLVENLVQMLTSNPETKDLFNYRQAAEILSAILSANHSIVMDDDIRRAIHAVSKLGRTLIGNFKSVERDNIILAFVDSSEFALTRQNMLTEVSQALFEIGVCAAQEKHDFVVVAVLDRLTSLAESQLPLSIEFSADIFGLLADYWATGGSRQEYANMKFQEVKRFLGRNKILALKKAQAHLIKTMYFDEADNLKKMIQTLKRTRK